MNALTGVFFFIFYSGCHFDRIPSSSTYRIAQRQRNFLYSLPILFDHQVKLLVGTIQISELRRNGNMRRRQCFL